MLDPEADFTRLTDLALERLGGRAVIANDEFFAPKENLLKQEPAIFLPDKYTYRGKWMDGWETRRRRDPGHDWCIIELGVPGTIRGVDVDTTHFKGNHPEACSVDACYVDAGHAEGAAHGAAHDPPGETLNEDDVSWIQILPKSSLQAHSTNLFPTDPEGCFSHVRLNIFPDGGVARFRVYGEAKPDWERLMASSQAVDLAAAVNGGTIIDCSDMFFSSPQNLIMPDRAANMSDGWETRRRRGAGHDWCIIKLGRRGLIDTIQVDTNHFKGNYPDECSLEVADFTADEAANVNWHPILPPTKLQADQLHRFAVDADSARPCTHVRLNIYPDGGVSRLRLYGRPVSY